MCRDNSSSDGSFTQQYFNNCDCNDNNDSDDELPMGDFTPVQKPLHNLHMTTNSPSYTPNDMPVNSPKDFGQLNNTMSANYHQQYMFRSLE